jgi:hypothetical protein
VIQQAPNSAVLVFVLARSTDRLPRSMLRGYDPTRFRLSEWLPGHEKREHGQSAFLARPLSTMRARPKSRHRNYITSRSVISQTSPSARQSKRLSPFD